jgi:hypothetical protein
VSNFAPSISAAIGAFIPQKYIWQASVALHSAPRFLFACLLNQHLFQRLQITPNISKLIRTSLLLQFLENLSLLVLTIVSSQENFDIHSIAFGTFVATSLLYMSIVVYLVTRCGYKPDNRYEKTGLDWKVWLYKAYLFVGFFMVLFYYRHNAYCEPYVYSFFGICEYLLVIFNIAFHGTAYYDFYFSEISVSRSVLGGSYPPSPNTHKTHQGQGDQVPLLQEIVESQ